MGDSDTSEHNALVQTTPLVHTQNFNSIAGGGAITLYLELVFYVTCYTMPLAAIIRLVR